MIYNIKAIPTTYAGTRFRSRLEARWAAFFDLAGVKWEYEPFDLDGWAPDFLIKTDPDSVGLMFDPESVLCEVKPVDIDDVILNGDVTDFEKAVAHSDKHPVILLGYAPKKDGGIGFVAWGEPFSEQWSSVYDTISLRIVDSEWMWREAGNIVQWNAA